MNKYLDNLIKEATALLKHEYSLMLGKNSSAGVQLLKVLTELADEIMIYRDDTVLCKYQYLLCWRKYTMTLEGNLLVTVFLANYSIRFAKFINKFNWKLVIDHDNEILNSILRQGMVDNHYHLGGSLPVFQSTWIEIMKNKLYRNCIASLFSDKNYYLSKAAWIRQNLVKFLSERYGGDNKNITLKGLETYYKEREFLYHIIRELIQNDLSETPFINLFYNYLTIKEWFRGLVVQCGNQIGEQVFFLLTVIRIFYLNGIIIQRKL